MQCKFLEPGPWPLGCSKDDFVTSECCTLPMGWSWSLFFYQRLLESCALEAGLVVGDRIEDRTHSGLVSPGRHVRAQYVDNFVCGTEPSAGQGKLDAIVMILRVRSRFQSPRDPECQPHG